MQREADSLYGGNGLRLHCSNGHTYGHVTKSLGMYILKGDLHALLFVFY